MYMNSICLFGHRVILKKLTRRREVGEGGVSTKKNKGEDDKNGPKRVDVYCEWLLFKSALGTDLGFRYAKLVRLKISFKHILVKKLKNLSGVPTYIGTSPSVKIAITHESHLWKSVRLLLLFFINSS